MPYARSVTRHEVVEGEPGIFPDNIARFYRWVVRVGLRLLGRKPL